MQYRYLISRTVDPLFGIAIGLGAFYVHERRMNRPEGHTLKDLLIKKYASK